jgi:mRNA interferase MazF
MMQRFRPGTVVLVNFPFTDRQSSKVRPALVLTGKGLDVIILGIFSRVPYQTSESWIKLEETMEGFAQTGLKKTSLIKTEKITVVHESLIRKEIGFLPDNLMWQVRSTLAKTLQIN